jgi:hypothetical protein
VKELKEREEAIDQRLHELKVREGAAAARIEAALAAIKQHRGLDPRRGEEPALSRSRQNGASWTRRSAPTASFRSSMWR